MGFPRQGYWRRLPIASPGDRPGPGIKPASTTLAGEFFTTGPPGMLRMCLRPNLNRRVFQKDERDIEDAGVTSVGQVQ